MDQLGVIDIDKVYIDGAVEIMNIDRVNIEKVYVDGAVRDNEQR